MKSSTATARSQIVAQHAPHRPASRRSVPGRLHSSGTSAVEPDPDASFVAGALAGSAPARTRMRSCGRHGPDARYWAIASARRDREIVSSARLILVISKRVSDLSADPPDACSRAAGQLTRRAARLLQSPLSGTVAGGHALAAGIAQERERRRRRRSLLRSNCRAEARRVGAFASEPRLPDHDRIELALLFDCARAPRHARQGCAAGWAARDH